MALHVEFAILFAFHSGIEISLEARIHGTLHPAVLKDLEA